MIEKLFLQYGYKDFQHDRQFVDGKKLALEYEKKFLSEKYNYLYRENNKIIGAASMNFFKTLSEIWDKNVFFVRDFVVDEKIKDSYDNLLKEFLEKYEKDIDFLIIKQPIDNYNAINALIKNNFYYVCNEVIYTLNLTKHVPEAVRASEFVREAEEKDLDFIKKMVYGNHKFNRYLFDPVFSISDVTKLYEKVIEQSFKNKHHRIYVYEKNGKILGFITTIYNQKISYMMDNRYGSFDYIIVDEKFQKQGIASSLMHHALIDFLKEDIRIVSVKTMANNYPSIRLLIKDNFFVTSQNIVLHQSNY